MNIKQKFQISFGILLLLSGTVGLLMLRQADRLGEAIDVILRENYQSVIICQNVNESLERINSELLLSAANWKSDNDQIFFKTQINNINKQWAAELRNLTIPGEHEMAHEIAGLLKNYFAVLPEILDRKSTPELRQKVYIEQVFPLFVQLKIKTASVLELNQKNMTDANNTARIEAKELRQAGMILLGAGLLFLAIFSWLMTHWVQKPLRKLITMTNEIGNGNLALTLDFHSKDEIGQLASSFNAMAAALRNARGQLMSRLNRSEQINKDIFSELPTPITIFDVQSERIQISTQSADKYFGLKEGRHLDELKYDWLKEIFKRVKQHEVTSIAEGNQGIIQHFIDGKEYFYQPTAMPIPADSRLDLNSKLTGVLVIFKDVTLAHEQQELKRSVISTVSHQLKTPLTSLEMSIYLLLEEKCGAVNPEQLDLLMSMREDSGRLTEIITDLLDLNKASAPGNLDTAPIMPNELLNQVKSRFQDECREHEIKLEIHCELTAPAISVALNRINYAFDNLIANAIRFTKPGGKIRLEAKVAEDAVELTVSDTGCGMSEEVQSHIFEQFYRGPGQDFQSGVGLGLSIVKEIIQSHGGKISVQSKENVGTAFTFTLPVTPPRSKSNQPKEC